MGLLIGVGVGDRGVDRGSKARGQVHIDEAEALALQRQAQGHGALIARAE